MILKKLKLPFYGIFIFLALFAFLTFTSIGQAATGPKKLLDIPQRAYRRACDVGPFGTARCHAQVVTDSNGKPLSTPHLQTGNFGPVQFHTAYNLPCTPGGPVSSVCQTPSSFPSSAGFGLTFAVGTVELEPPVVGSPFDEFELSVVCRLLPVDELSDVDKPFP